MVAVWVVAVVLSKERTCLRDIEVVEMVYTLMIVWLEQLSGWWYHLQNKGIYRQRQVCKENTKSETQV